MFILIFIIVYILEKTLAHVEAEKISILFLVEIAFNDSAGKETT